MVLYRNKESFMIQVILAFAGSGKTTFAKQMQDQLDKRVIDLDSGKYSKEENFPDNYIEVLLRILKEEPTSIVLMSTHQEVIARLRLMGIKHILAYPTCEWEEWKGRYESRHDPASWIAMMGTRWAGFITDFKNTPNDGLTIKIPLGKDQYLYQGIENNNHILQW